MKRNDQRPRLAAVITLGHVEIEATPRLSIPGAKETDARIGALVRFKRREVIPGKGLRKEGGNGRQSEPERIETRRGPRVLMHRPQRAHRARIPRLDEPTERFQREIGRGIEVGCKFLEPVRYGPRTERCLRHREGVANRRGLLLDLREIRRMEMAKRLFERIEAYQQRGTESPDRFAKRRIKVFLVIHRPTVCSGQLTCEPYNRLTDQRPRIDRWPLRGTMISSSRRPATHSRLLVRSLLAIPFFAFAAFIALPAIADAPSTDDEKAFYLLGTNYAQQLKTLEPMSDREISMLILGLRDELGGNALAVDQQQGAGFVRTMVEKRKAQALALEHTAAATFVAAEAKKKGAKTTESGLVYIELKAGNGASPSATQTVSVHYHGTLRDGTVFDSSVDRGQPAEFPLNRVIPCWTEGVAMMKVGGKSMLICPAEIAYGDQQKGSIPGGAALSFEVELLEIK